MDYEEICMVHGGISKLGNRPYSSRPAAGTPWLASAGFLRPLIYHFTILRGRRHHSYLWPLFLAREHYPGLIKDILENFEIHPSLEANDKALRNAGKGGFEEQWPVFALSLLNFEPYDRLVQWDHLSSKVKIKEETELQLESGHGENS
jgi:hypothetical protein